MRNRRLTALLAAVLAASQLGCEKYLTPELYFFVPLFWRTSATSSEETKVFQRVFAREQARREERRLYEETMVRSLAAAAQAAATAPRGASQTNGAAIAPDTTLFGFTLTGILRQFDMSVDPPKAVRSLSTGQNLKDGVAAPGNSFLYLLSTGAQSGTGGFAPSLRIIDLSTFQEAGSIALPTTSIPFSLAVTPDGESLYIAAPLRGQTFTDPVGVDCHLIDLTSRTLVETFRFLGSQPRPETVATADGGRVFLTAYEGVAVIDTLTRSVSHIISDEGFNVFGGPAHIAVDPTGTYLFMAPVRSGQSSGVGVYDIATSTRIAHTPIADLSTMTMAVSPDGAYLVVDHIVSDPATGLNDFPSLEFLSIPSGNIVQTLPWSASREDPVTVGQLLPIPPPAP
ncbi:MAG: hypothetical protein GC160_27435 [Acidobacteria bacterium]|nr:hypothetical protein [Acidobacteriota bacterium]